MNDLVKDWGFWTFVVSVIVMLIGDGGLIAWFKSLWQKIHPPTGEKKSYAGFKRLLIILAFLILIAGNVVMGYFVYDKFFPREEIGFVYVLNEDETVTITGVKDKELTDYVIPNEIKKKPVVEIADNAFAGTKAIDITIPANVEKVGEKAFTGCKNLINITVDEDNEVFESDHGILFNELKTKVLCYPEGKKLGEVVVSAEYNPEIEWRLYESGVLWISGKGRMGGYPTVDEQPWAEYRNNITSVIFDGYITGIGSRVFMKCKNLAYVILPESLTEIGWSSFEDCDSLNEIIIPDAVTAIYPLAFYHCNTLKKVVIGSGLSDLDAKAFIAARPFSEIIVSSENQYYTAKDNHLYNKDITELLFYADYKSTEFKIPSTITIIGRYACQGDHFTEVVIPNGITELQEGSMEWCKDMKSITIPLSVKTISQYAFNQDDSLADVYYEGTKQQWQQIKIERKGNDYLFKATIHYQGEQQ